ELGARPKLGGDIPFREWVEARTSDPLLRRLFERFAHFALSIEPDQISYEQMRAVFFNIARHGFPCAPAGGCRALVEQLAAGIRARGGCIRTATQVTEIVFDSGGTRVAGIRLRDRRSAIEELVQADFVVSDAGPRATARLLS